jgi:large subunit ribosomal protein L23
MHTFIIKKPVVSEKTLALIEKESTYVFQVSKSAEKNQIKKMIKDLFKVDVVSVNTVLGHRSNKKTGRKRLRVTTDRTKKALVKIKAGQKIELFDLEPQAKK